jgi:hypothetical protein
VTIGREIGVDQAEFNLPTRDGGGFQEPWAAWLDSILLVTYPRSSDAKEIKTHEIWRPQTGTFEEAWRTPAGMQDLLLDQSGDWFLTLRTDHNLGSPVWELILRNLQSGEARTLAQGNPEVAKVPGLPWRLPYGLGAAGSVSGETVVWVEFYLDSTGSAGRRIQVYDISSQETSTLASAADVFSEQLWSPSVAGQRVAWMHLQTKDSPNEIILFDLSTKASRRIPVEGGRL